MKTKQRIINQAILSYNRLGVANVTSRDVAKAIGISHGNLEYHYPNKEALLLAIYKQMKKEAAKVYEMKDKDADDPFIHFNELLKALEHFQEKYLFFNLDVLEISRNYPKVGALLAKTFEVRKEQMSHLHQRFLDIGYLKRELKPGIYLRLQHTIRIMITFWCSQKEILPYLETMKKSSMSQYIWELLIPHMTEKGFGAYQKLTMN
ncbi:TetR/AcrR family transcriptional regulator [Flagellimonas sp.]|uniref:TetR/AcrR family transcriptional regulator n=1 Tax=Flagellimonas sp. TaxID=2058762 RepID=UPI003B500F02